jgi:hypothetical protein
MSGVVFGFPKQFRSRFAMETPKRRPAPDAVADESRPARKSTEVQPVKEQDVALETYEQSPERPGGDERNRQVTPDGPMSDRERGTPD